MLLSQVKRIEPQAFIRERERTIQVGVFSQENNAQQQVQILERQGLRARVVPVNGTRRTGGDNPIHSGYFVVIPGSRSNLAEMVAKVREAGISDVSVQEREAPRGPHVAVGPFGDRHEADRWSSTLRSTGMDARVYFGR